MSSPLPLWFKGLTPELKRVAEDTIGETKEVRERSLKELRKLVEDQQDLRSRLDDVFLLRFLRTKKHDVRKSLRLLRSYYGFREKQCGTFVGTTPSEVRHIVRDMGAVLYSPRRMPNGSHVAIYRLGQFDVGRATAQQLVSTALLIGEMILECEATQVCGGVILVDLGGMSIHHYAQFLSINFLSFLVSIIQDCLPERLKAVHIVNEPFLFHAIYKMIRPLLKKKLKERVRFHGHNLSSLHKCVPRDLLPVELGGELTRQDNAVFENHFFAQEPYIQGIAKFGLVGQGDAAKSLYGL